jgi:hypothetical protein
MFKGLSIAELTRIVFLSRKAFEKRPKTTTSVLSNQQYTQSMQRKLSENKTGTRVPQVITPQATTSELETMQLEFLESQILKFVESVPMGINNDDLEDTIRSYTPNVDSSQFDDTHEFIHLDTTQGRKKWLKWIMYNCGLTFERPDYESGDAMDASIRMLPTKGSSAQKEGGAYIDAVSDDE